MRIYEDEENDRAERENAIAAFNSIYQWLNQNHANLNSILKPHTELFQPIEAQNGSLCLIIQNVKLVLVFEPFKTPSGDLVDGASGPGKGGWISIFLPALSAPNNTTDLPARFARLKNVFVHEYMHFLLIRREQPSRERSAAKQERLHQNTYAKRDYGSNQAADRGDWGGYFNNPQETNAYYQEAITNVTEILTNLDRFDKRRLGQYTTQELIAWVKRYFDFRFIQNLNQENIRKLDKRLARFVEQSLRPLLNR